MRLECCGCQHYGKAFSKGVKSSGTAGQLSGGKQFGLPFSASDQHLAWSRMESHA
jgi:hypothetical protein